MTPSTTMITMAAKGTPTLTTLSHMPLPFTPPHLKTLKVGGGNNTNGPILQSDPPSTFCYMEKHIAHPLADDTSLPTHNGQHKPINLDVICHEIKCENEQFTKFMANLFPPHNKDPTAMIPTTTVKQYQIPGILDFSISNTLNS